MSQSNHSSSSSEDYDSAISSYLVETTVYELSRMMMQPNIVQIAQRTFAEAPTPLTYLRYYQHLSQTISNLRLDLERHRREQQAIYDILFENQHFHVAISPIILEYRRQRNQTINTPVTSPTEPPVNLPEEQPIHVPTTPDFPQTVPILPISVPIIETTRASSPLLSSPFEPRQGTRNEPIDVDRLPSTPLSLHIAQLHRTRSTPASGYCDHCRRTGHATTNCVWTGVIICDYCKEVGHQRSTCTELRRDVLHYNAEYQFCVVCGEPGHSVRNCQTLHQF